MREAFRRPMEVDRSVTTSFVLAHEKFDSIDNLRSSGLFCSLLSSVSIPVFPDIVRSISSSYSSLSLALECFFEPMRDFKNVEESILLEPLRDKL